MYKLGLFYRTLKDLKLIQLVYRLWYLIKGHQSLKINKYTKDVAINKFLQFPSNFCFSPSKVNYKDNIYELNFLNKSHLCSLSELDWNISDFGKLWTYNLCYFDYLNTNNLSTEDKFALIDDFVSNSEKIIYGMDTYPISLRGMNWIKFFIQARKVNSKYSNNLLSQYNLLLGKLEFDILGNHLLENGFSLIFAAYYFKEKRFYKKGYKILKRELDEQILSDGAHFELSPMYHQIIIYRIFECINLISNNNWIENDLKEYLINKSSLMLSWLNRITFSNGDIPMVNDCIHAIAPSSHFLSKYAKFLNLTEQNLNLSESGYRTMKSKAFELFFDVGAIGPKYIPAHAHADSLNFVLYFEGKPIIVDPGVSTYENNERRQLERGTSMHNTISIDNTNSSEVWSSFRVGNKAATSILKDEPNQIIASHNGYKAKYGVICKRKIEINNDCIEIDDQIIGNQKEEFKSILNLHLHPNCNPTLKNNDIFLEEGIKISLKNCQSISLDSYLYAHGYRKLQNSKKITLKLKNQARIVISNHN